MKRLNDHIIRKMVFFCRVDFDRLNRVGERLLLFFYKRAYKRNVFSAKDWIAGVTLKSHISQRYFIRAVIHAVNDKLPSVDLQLHANGNVVLGICLVKNFIAAGFIRLRKHEAVSMLQQPLCGACPLSKIIAGHSGFAHTGNIALQQAAIQSAGGSFCIRAIKKQPFSDTDTDELFGMLCTKRLVCRNIRRKLAPLICDSCEDSGKRLGSVFQFVTALAEGWNVAEMRDSFICGINSIERTVNFYALTHKVLDTLRQLWCWLLWRFLPGSFEGAHLCLRLFVWIIAIVWLLLQHRLFLLCEELILADKLCDTPLHL